MCDASAHLRGSTFHVVKSNFFELFDRWTERCVCWFMELTTEKSPGGHKSVWINPSRFYAGGENRCWRWSPLCSSNDHRHEQPVRSPVLCTCNPESTSEYPSRIFRTSERAQHLSLFNFSTLWDHVRRSAVTSASLWKSRKRWSANTCSYRRTVCPRF